MTTQNPTDNGLQAGQIDSVLHRLGTLQEFPDRIANKLVVSTARDAAATIATLRAELELERATKAA